VSDNATEPPRQSPPARMSAKMSSLSRKDTGPELRLRRELHSRGLRYRLQVKVPDNRRRTIDIVFSRARLAVFVDGCFWHGCPSHGVRPLTNREWWNWKISRNQARDVDTNVHLEARGWHVIRIWEHEDMMEAALRIESAVRALTMNRTQRNS
jgi:DNA mismatch endonuclease (patch repair protein)